MFQKDNSLNVIYFIKCAKGSRGVPWPYNQSKAFLLLIPWEVWWLWWEVSILNEHIHIFCSFRIESLYLP